MIPVYLHGGGAHPTADVDTYGRFVNAAKQGTHCQILLVILAEAADDLPEYQAIFEQVGAVSDDIVTMLVSPDSPLSYQTLTEHQPTGVFVCGGLTPHYQQALCSDHSWLTYLKENALPYGGTSAGAAIAADHAIVGGWRVRRGEIMTQMIFQGAGEGIDLLGVWSGLGLVPFSVDVHANQFGTLTRLIHAVDTGEAVEGWAIDENTMLVIDSDSITIHGIGQAYHMRRNDKGVVEVKVYPGGSSVINGSL